MRCFTFLLIASLCGPALAVSTSTWTQTNQDDFKKGTLDNVVATNLGDLKLSRAVKTLLEQDPRISSVNALAEAPDGTIYAGTGPEGVLLAIRDQKVSTVTTLERATNLTALLVEKSGRLLIGTAGQHGRVLAIDKPGDKPHVIFEADGVQYVWQLAQTPDGNLYIATGPTGKLFELTPEGVQKVLLDSGENNLLSLVSDGGDLLYAGSDPHGLVYRVNRKTGESFILYNAPEAEVGALALDGHGNLYAATSEARDASPQPAPNPSASEPQGRPEGGETGVPIPSENPKQPKPPALPNPNPGEPNPIPRSANPTALLGSMKHSVTLPISLARYSGRGQGEGLLCTASTELPILKTALTPTLSRSTGRGGNSVMLDAQLGHDVLLIEDAPAIAPDPGPAQIKRRRPQPGPTPNPDPGQPQPPTPPVPAPGGNAPDQAGAMNRQPPVNTANAGEPRAEGNAVYKIDHDGFVTEIFRQPVLVLAMAEHNGTLLIATGSEGEIYQVNPSADETVVLAKVDPKQVTCLLSAGDGNVYMGTANVGSLDVLSSGFANKGTYTSPVLDATQISRFGKINLHGTLPSGTTLTVSSRSGNVKEPDEKGWSDWAEEAKAEEFLQIKSPAARFLQYRLTFESKEGASTPVVDDISVAYQMPNMPPQVKSIKVAGNPDTPATATPGSDAAANPAPLVRVQPTPKQIIAWDASDPNGDALLYSLYFRRLPSEPWILLKDKLTDPQFEWDTRTVADGRYQVKVIASDANANPPGQGKTASRVSDPVVVDNTPPVIGDLKTTQKGQRVQLDFKIVDETSTVAACDFSVDSNRDWQMVLPVDNIFDSPEETVSFSTSPLTPGPHQITLRATDAKGNQAFQSVFVTIKGPVAEK